MPLLDYLYEKQAKVTVFDQRKIDEISKDVMDKITKYSFKDTHKDILDVEGFQVDEIRSWKYVNIVTFLSTDIIIL